MRLIDRLIGVDPIAEEIEIKTGFGGGDCGYGFERGRDYIVYAYKSRDGFLETGICSRTAPLASAQEDMAYFRSLKDAPSTGEIRVVGIDINKPRVRYNDPGLEGLPGVNVRLSGVGVNQDAVTGSSGRYTFAGLPPGKYAVEAMLRDHVLFDPLKPVQVPAKVASKCQLLCGLIGALRVGS